MIPLNISSICATPSPNPSASILIRSDKSEKPKKRNLSPSRIPEFISTKLHAKKNDDQAPEVDHRILPLCKAREVQFRPLLRSESEQFLKDLYIDEMDLDRDDYETIISNKGYAVIQGQRHHITCIQSTSTKNLVGGLHLIFEKSDKLTIVQSIVSKLKGVATVMLIYAFSLAKSYRCPLIKLVTSVEGAFLYAKFGFRPSSLPNQIDWDVFSFPQKVKIMANEDGLADMNCLELNIAALDLQQIIANELDDTPEKQREKIDLKTIDNPLASLLEGGEGTDFNDDYEAVAATENIAPEADISQTGHVASEVNAFKN